MHWVLQFIIRHKAVSSLLLTVSLSLWMLSGTSQQQQLISRGLLLSVFYPLHFTVSQATRVSNIFSENRELRQEVTQLTARIGALEEQAIENERLRELLGFTADFPYDIYPARVVAREPSPVYRGAVLNVGKNQGVMRFMPVINKDGIIGKVIQVMPNICFVQLLKDPSARTSVMIKRTRLVGILETETGENFYIRYRIHADVQEEDEIITSGLGGIYPRGLMVARVSSIKNDRDPLFKKVYVKPAVNFNHIEEVFVLRLSPQWSAFIMEVDSVRFSR